VQKNMARLQAINGSPSRLVPPFKLAYLRWLIPGLSEIFRVHAFELACAPNGIGHSLTKLRHPGPPCRSSA
jgi:hypothetical protein